MSRRALVGALLALGLGLLAGGYRARGPAAQPAPHRPGPPPRLFAFVSGAGGAELDHLRRYGRRISVIAPNWYELSLGTRSLTGGPSPTVVALARAVGGQLWPVVNERLGPGAIIGGAHARTRVAAAIAAEAARREYAGITLDIEQLPTSQAPAFDAFVRVLAARLHAQRERLAVYVPRRTATGGDRSYDWPALLRCADLLIASGYNEHSATGSPGPVSTAAGLTQMLDYAASLSRRRVAPAIGAFGYAWPLSGGPGRLISSVAADRMLARSRARVHGRGGDTSFVADGSVVHYQSAAGLIARALDARDVGMRWLALFSLGREPDAFWNGIRTARERK